MRNIREPHLIAALAGCFFFVLVSASAFILLDAARAEKVADQSTSTVKALATIIPQVSAERGKKLFANKACVVCHSVNNVGGKAATALDAPDGTTAIDVLAFAARMWRGADAMIVCQSIELGYQINLTGQEVADIAAFVYDKESQTRFTEDDVPEIIQTWFLEDPVVIDEDMLAPD